MPPPNPVADSRDTEVWAMANGPRLAEMLLVVGVGPRWYGFAAWAPAQDQGSVEPYRQSSEISCSKPLERSQRKQNVLPARTDEKYRSSLRYAR